MNEGSEDKNSSKKEKDETKISSVTITKSLHTVDTSHNFRSSSSFFLKRPSFTPQQQHSSNRSVHFYNRPSNASAVENRTLEKEC